MDLAIRLFKMKDLPPEADVLPVTAGKVGGNLPDGHGMGYGDETLCANIVKCRWALADCEFCIQTLDHLATRTKEARYQELLEQSRAVSDAIKERIARLRARVWW